VKPILVNIEKSETYVDEHKKSEPYIDERKEK